MTITDKIKKLHFSGPASVGGSFLWLSLLLLSSCNDYLDTIPSKGNNEVLTRSEQVEALFNNSETFLQKASIPLASADDVEMSTSLYDAMGYLGEDFLNGLTWNTQDVANAQYGDAYWEDAYNKVFKANLVINEIGQLTDADNDQKAEYLAQAYFLRAMSMWNLAQIYCQPYGNETLQTPGLPLKQTTSYEESTARATLSATYDYILTDLKAALQTRHADVEKRWWVSLPAVKAMMARFYLFTGQYAEAETYAEEALKSTTATLEDYNTYITMPALVMNPSTAKNDTVFYSQLYQYAPNEVADYAENYFSMYFVVRDVNLIPSELLLSLYDRDADLRFSQFFNKHELWSLSVSGFGDDIMYRRMKSNMNDDLLPAGPTVPEMILTAAEAMARQGKTAEAMTMVNRLRQARMKHGATNVLLAANTAAEAVEKILEERHREMPFMMRWWDIRRLAYNEMTDDDVPITHTFYDVSGNTVNGETIYTYTLPVKSARYAQPITNKEITRSGNMMEQNTYTNADVQRMEQ
jgi:tetratricopeptide (TPR) repeat protein